MNHQERQVLVDLLDEISTAAERAASKLRAATPPTTEPKPPLAPKPQPDWLTTKAVAQWLHLSPQTFRKWRWSGGGPAYVKFGQRVVYRREEVERWLAERTFKHTADETVRRGSR